MLSPSRGQCSLLACCRVCAACITGSCIHAMAWLPCLLCPVPLSVQSQPSLLCNNDAALPCTCHCCAAVDGPGQPGAPAAADGRWRARAAAAAVTCRGTGQGAAGGQGQWGRGGCEQLCCSSACVAGSACLTGSCGVWQGLAFWHTTTHFSTGNLGMIAHTCTIPYPVGVARSEQLGWRFWQRPCRPCCSGFGPVGLAPKHS